VSVAELMAAAGLTHGVSTATLSLRTRLPQSRVQGRSTRPSALERTDFWTRDPKSALTALVDVYLSSRNRGLMCSGCPWPVGDGLAREPEGKPVKGAYLVA